MSGVRCCDDRPGCAVCGDHAGSRRYRHWVDTGRPVRLYVEAAAMIGWSLLTWPVQSVMARVEMWRWQRAQAKR